MFAWQGSCVSDSFQSIKGQDRNSHWKKRCTRPEKKGKVRGERGMKGRKEEGEGRRRQQLYMPPD